jgi:tetratricopeptide (TPR) repeat protein
MSSTVGDYARAAELYERALRLQPNNTEALNGLATAEFDLGRYAAARLHFAAVLQREPEDQAAATMERIADTVLALDPNARVAGPERRARVIRDFQIASARLQQCKAVTLGTWTPMTATLQALAARQAMLSARVTDRNLRDDPDLAQNALELVFSVEEEAQSLCGPLSAQDDALLRIASMHSQ